MNDRIRDIAEQAGFKVNWQHPDVQAIKMARFEKFAELIVRECATLIPAEQSHAPNGQSLLKIFEEHFGVEQ